MDRGSADENFCWNHMVQSNKPIEQLHVRCVVVSSFLIVLHPHTTASLGLHLHWIVGATPQWQPSSKGPGCWWDLIKIFFFFFFFCYPTDFLLCQLDKLDHWAHPESLNGGPIFFAIPFQKLFFPFFQNIMRVHAALSKIGPLLSTYTTAVKCLFIFLKSQNFAILFQYMVCGWTNYRVAADKSRIPAEVSLMPTSMKETSSWLSSQ